jgi:apolipoprotein N-acyltransferase
MVPAASTGVLTALAFPKFNLFFLSWISLIPLLYILYRNRPGRSFFLGWCAGLAYYLVLLYWIPSVPAHYGDLSWGFSMLTYIGFAAFLALFWAAFAWLFSRLRAAYPRSVFILGGLLWVTFEFMLTHLLTGFPWGLLGYSQYHNLAFIQAASVAGVYGLSFLLFILQSSFVSSMIHKKRAPFLLTLALILLVHAAGWLALKDAARTDSTFRGAVIQGNVPAETDFTRISDDATRDLLERHLALSREAGAEGAEFIVWAELSVPLCFSCNYAYFPQFTQVIAAFAREQRCTLLMGTNEIAFSQGKPEYFNTAVNLTPDGRTSFYAKMHLVPFGEYTPYKWLFSFIANFTHAIGELTPGDSYVLHEFQGIPYASPICYEIIFPNIARRFARLGARFLVTITNDGWYGRSSAPYQHFAIAVLRAVETRRFLLRSATTGISGIIDPYGRVLQRSRLDTTTFLTDDVTPLTHLSFYVRYGDWLPWGSLTLSCALLILAMIKRRHERQVEPS